MIFSTRPGAFNDISIPKDKRSVVEFFILIKVLTVYACRPLPGLLPIVARPVDCGDHGIAQVTGKSR